MGLKLCILSSTKRKKKIKINAWLELTLKAVISSWTTEQLMPESPNTFEVANDVPFMSSP